MAHEVFMVSNVKCAGCVSNICQGLLAVEDISEVDVDLVSGQVDVKGARLDRAYVAGKLAELGYPVST